MSGQPYSLQGMQAKNSSSIQPGLPVRNRVPVPYAQNNTYVRPADWLTLPHLNATDNKLVTLVPIFNGDGNYAAFSCTCSTTFNVDWGDGTNDNWSSGATATHQYSWSTISSSTLTSEGFRQAIVTITVNAGGVFNTFNFTANHPSTPYVVTQMLDLAFNAPSCTAITFGSISRLEKLYIGQNSITSFNAMSWCGGAPLRLRWVSIYAPVATDFTGMFEGCNLLSYVQLTGTSKVTIMDLMFYGCSSLQTAPFFDTSAVTSFRFAFSDMNSLTTVPLYNTCSATDMSGLFETCSSLQTVPLFNTSQVTNMTSMFSGCLSLQTIPKFDTSKVTSFYQMFYSCPSLTSVPLLNTHAGTDFTEMLGSNSMYSQGNFSLTSVPLFDLTNATTLSGMFGGCTALKSVPAFKTSTALTNTSYMFYQCTSLKSAPLFTTTNVTDMSYMFYNCSSLTSVPLYDMSNNTSTTYMFYSCVALTTIPTFNTANVTNWTYMFQLCNSLTTIPALNPNISGVYGNINAYYVMTYSCFMLASFLMIGCRESLNFSYCALDATTLNTIFTNLGTADPYAVITITGCPGAGGCNQSIATGKGWTVTN